MGVKDIVNVYWSPLVFPNKSTLINLMWQPPTNVQTILPSGKNIKNSYRSCSALPELLRNTYAILHPKTTSVVLNGPFENPTLSSEDPHWFHSTNSLENCYRVDYDAGWIFFAEESLKIKVTPPYLHNTEASKTGFIGAGSFDIGKWYRPVTFAYNLWPGKNTMSFIENEPAMYVEFETTKKVVLRQFEMTQELFEVSQQTVGFKNIIPGLSLDKLYEKFIGSNRHKRVLNLIKQNIL
jgi:hypothetical protein